MKVSEQPAERVFAHAHYTVRYSHARRARWVSRARPDYSALFLLGGAMRWSASVEESEAEAEDSLLAVRDSLLVAPGESAEASGERAEYVAVTLAPAFVLDCAVRARLTRADAHISFRAPAVRRDVRLARLARDLADELLEEVAGQELVVSAIVEQLMIHLLRRHASIRRAGGLELSRAGLVDRRIRRAIELMQAHMGRDLPLEELASAAHLSPFHFARLFKKLTGATPHAYLASMRAARAQTLLAETDLSIIEVGARVGYSSPSHFAKAFRRDTGLSPRAFRAALVRP